MPQLLIALLSAALVLSCGGQPRETSPGQIPIREYPPVPAEQRAASRILLEEDLVLEDDETTLEHAFYYISGLDVDARGNIYALDAGAYEVRVFAHDGSHLFSFGRQGQGPGEFEQPRAIALLKDQIAVLAGPRKLSIWSRTGQHENDYALDDTFMLAFGIDRNAFVGIVADGYGNPRLWPFAVATVSSVGRELARFARTTTVRATPTTGPIPRVVRPLWAVSRGGAVYVTSAHEYEVAAYSADGTPAWTIRVDQPPRTVTAEDIDRAMEIARRRQPGVGRADFDEWPERFPALSYIAVDGHGHLYVYPFIWRGDVRTERPVDVYSPEGEWIFSAMIKDYLWWIGWDNYLYAFGEHPENGESSVFRFRIVEEPF
ncbi:MAG: 6-bladed beta-propeller [Acidobacteriota bacterium]